METQTPNRAREELSDSGGRGKRVAANGVGKAGTLRGSLCPPSWPLVGDEGPLCGWGGWAGVECDWAQKMGHCWRECAA